MPDQALLTIAEAAERGDEMPGICLFTGVLSIFGIPTSSPEARDLMQESLVHTMLRSESRLRRRKDAVSLDAIDSWFVGDFESSAGGSSGFVGFVSFSGD